MTIEQDISQSKFSNEYQKSLVNLIFTYNWLTERMKLIFDREGITPQQFNILRILRGAGKPLSTLQIRQRMLDRMSDTSRLVDRMVRKGLVKKTICANDKRLVDVNITEAGLLLLTRMDRYQPEMDAVMQGLTDKEAVQLNRLLDKIRNAHA